MSRRKQLTGKQRRRRAARWRQGKRRAAMWRDQRADAAVVLGVEGPPCPRCQQATEMREHRAVTWLQLRQPFYFARWYWCANPECKTTMISFERDKVWRDGREVGSDRERG